MSNDMRQDIFVVDKVWNRMVDLKCCKCGRMVADLKSGEMEKLAPDVFLAKKELSCFNCKISLPAGKVVAPYILDDKSLAKFTETTESGGENKPIWAIYGARGRSIKVYENKCVIKTDVTLGSLLTHNATDGEKTIYYADVVGVQFKEPGVTLGYLQLETAGGIGNNRGSNFFNENTFTYETTHISGVKMQKIVDYIKMRVEEYKEEKNKTVAPVSAAVSVADEIKKFKELLDMGVITQEEFNAKKKQLLGL